MLESALLRELLEIGHWVRRHADAACVVAIDAPLIVANRSGRRPCDALITRCFGRHGAGAHPANLSLPAFSSGVRASVLARDLALDVDPYFAPATPVRRAIEVFPHPALVALFGLERPPPYKARAARSLGTRRRALLEVMGHLESLRDFDPPLDVTASPRWAGLRSVVAATAVGAELRRAEDEIDAHLCAYIGLYYWAHGTERCRVVGDLTSGYIVTPVAGELAACLDRAPPAAGQGRLGDP